MIYLLKSLVFLIPWAGCVLTDWAFHQIGLGRRGPWSWKWSVGSFGIGVLIVILVMRLFDPHFMEFPR